MATTEYEPQPSAVYLLNMLQALWFYWPFWPHSREWFERKPLEVVASLGDQHSFGEIEATLDLSLAKIAFLIGVETASIRHDSKKKEMVARLNLQKQTQAEALKIAILEAFWRVAKKPGDTFNRIAEPIKKIY